MRRFVRSFAVLGAVGLCACGGAGSVLSSTSTPQRVIVTVAAPSNIARVLPGAGLPISAVGVSGAGNGVAGNNRFTWTAAVVTSGQYVANTGGQTKACAALSYTQAGGAAAAYAPDYSVNITIDPTNPANIIFTPPVVVPLPAGAPAGSTVTTNYPYCVQVTATAVSAPSAQGTVTVAVVNPANPEQ
jgi:hypothetical protein